MTTPADLLPPNASLFERALAGTASATLEVPLRAAAYGASAPAAFLPFLAIHNSVDLWFEDWPLARKRDMIEQAIELGWLKGTRQATIRYLGFVDAQLIAAVSYPARFVIGKSSVGPIPIGHPPFKARHTVKVTLHRRPAAFEIMRSGIGLAALRPVSREPIERAKLAMRTAKAPETEYLVSFSWRRRVRFGDRPTFGAGLRFGAFRPLKPDQSEAP